MRGMNIRYRDGETMEEFLIRGSMSRDLHDGDCFHLAFYANHPNVACEVAASRLFIGSPADQQRHMEVTG